MLEPRVIKLIYEKSLGEFFDRLEELQNPRVIYVTDLVLCPLKRGFRLSFPYLSFSLEPRTVLGDLVHRGLQQILQEQGYEVEVEVSRGITIGNEEFVVKGRVDALGRDEVIEIKVSESPYESLPHKHHELQLKLYLELTGLSRGRLVYVGRQGVYEFPVFKDEGGLLDKLAEETVKASIAPRWDWECKLCVYSKMCTHKSK